MQRVWNARVVCVRHEHEEALCAFLRLEGVQRKLALQARRGVRHQLGRRALQRRRYGLKRRRACREARLRGGAALDHELLVARKPSERKHAEPLAFDVADADVVTYLARPSAPVLMHPTLPVIQLARLGAVHAFLALAALAKARHVGGRRVAPAAELAERVRFGLARCGGHGRLLRRGSAGCGVGVGGACRDGHEEGVHALRSRGE
eukprot:6000720-Prymnesium_polylepis.1